MCKIYVMDPIHSFVIHSFNHHTDTRNDTNASIVNCIGTALSYLQYYCTGRHLAYPFQGLCCQFYIILLQCVYKASINVLTSETTDIREGCRAYTHTSAVCDYSRL